LEGKKGEGRVYSLNHGSSKPKKEEGQNRSGKINAKEKKNVYDHGDFLS